MAARNQSDFHVIIFNPSHASLTCLQLHGLHLPGAGTVAGGLGSHTRGVGWRVGEECRRNPPSPASVEEKGKGHGDIWPRMRKETCKKREIMIITGKRKGTV